MTTAINRTAEKSNTEPGGSASSAAWSGRFTAVRYFGLSLRYFAGFARNFCRSDSEQK